VNDDEALQRIYPAEIVIFVADGPREGLGAVLKKTWTQV
jgi:hypothetical protein